MGVSNVVMYVMYFVVATYANTSAVTQPRYHVSDLLTSSYQLIMHHCWLQSYKLVFFVNWGQNHPYVDIVLKR